MTTNMQSAFATQCTHLKTSAVDLYAFQTILDFVKNLKEFFGTQKNDTCKALNMYHRLLSKMSFENDELILKHIDTFKQFCISNREAISESNKSLFTISKITFSERIFIDLEYIFGKADDDTSQTIWEYILAISAILDPANKAKDILKNIQSRKGEEDENFLNGLLNQISEIPNSSNIEGNPVEFLSSFMNNPVITNLLSNFGDIASNIDMNEIIETVNSLVGTDGQPDMQQMLQQTMQQVIKYPQNSDN